MPANFQNALCYTVSDINKYIKELISEDPVLSEVYVVGEISNCKLHYSGHIYFTLKDGGALLKCVMFKTYASKLKFRPEDGMKVTIKGNISVFERDGIYQLYCTDMEPDGLGSLMQAFEQLKEKLSVEGIFDVSRKRRLPLLPETVAVITSSTGAVIRDIINVSTRRFPNIRIRLLPVAVQGPTAAKQIAYAIRKANEMHWGDVIIVGRGGGSLEDLWPFNEEVVARAIYDSEIPVVSAVGHETDFTICDFAADLRAPTPSAAAELCVPSYQDETRRILLFREQLLRTMKKSLEYQKLLLSKLTENKLLKNPFEFVNQQRMEIDACVRDMENIIKMKLERSKRLFGMLASKLETLDPYAILQRGYTAVTAQSSVKPITKAEYLKPEDRITVKFSDGDVYCLVKEVKHG